MITKKNQIHILGAIILLSLILSLVFPGMTVFADDTSPPEDTSDVVYAPVEEAEAQETALPEDAPDEGVATILDQLPENTDVVVLDEQGEIVPMATQEAADIIESVDPMWCRGSGSRWRRLYYQFWYSPATDKQYG